MPQEPQQVDLEELTRLRGDEYTYYAGLMIWKAFPALRDELVTARKNNKDLIQDSCDAQEAAIECAKSFGVCIDNGPGYGEPNIFQLLEDIQKAGETMRDELVRLREATKPISIEGCTPGPWIWNGETGSKIEIYGPNGRHNIIECDPYDGAWLCGGDEDEAKANARLIASAPTLAAKKITLERQLDEAKGRLGAALNMYLMAGHKEARAKASVIAVTVLAEMGIELNRDDFEIQRSAFLASLAVSNPKQYAFTNCEGKTIHLPGDMTMEDMVRAGMTPHLVDKDAVSTDPKDFVHHSKQEQPTQGEVKS